MYEKVSQKLAFLNSVMLKCMKNAYTQEQQKGMEKERERGRRREGGRRKEKRRKGGRKRRRREGGKVRTASLARSLRLEAAIRQSLHKEGETGAGFQDFRFV